MEFQGSNASNFPLENFQFVVRKLRMFLRSSFIKGGLTQDFHLAGISSSVFWVCATYLVVL